MNEIHNVTKTNYYSNSNLDLIVNKLILFSKIVKTCGFLLIDMLTIRLFYTFAFELHYF